MSFFFGAVRESIHFPWHLELEHEVDTTFLSLQFTDTSLLSRCGFMAAFLMAIKVLLIHLIYCNAVCIATTNFCCDVFVAFSKSNVCTRFPYRVAMIL